MMMRKLLILTTMMLGLATAPVLADGAKSLDTYKQLDRLVQIFEQIRAEYVEEVDDGEVLEAAINGMLASLDPHSSYLGPENFTAMEVQIRGEYGGLGIVVVQNEDGFIQVVSPIDDTPAERAGMLGGDLITHINGDPVLGKSQDEAVEQMRGPKGTDITITVVREGVEEPFDVVLTREKIRLKSVNSRVERENIGYVRITQFNEQTTPGLREAIAELEQEIPGGMQGLILDLRNNPGGLLPEAISVSDAFLDEGEIVSTRSRRASENELWRAGSGDLIDGLPLVVLVNAGSASASEIVAGALQDHRRATVLGERTFGKGTVQTVIPLSRDSAIRLTTARYYTPSGRSIQERGIEPDISVSAYTDGLAPKARREEDLQGHLINEQDDPVDDLADSEEQEDGEAPKASIPTDEDGEPIDVQLQRALDLLQGVEVALNQTADDTVTN